MEQLATELRQLVEDISGRLEVLFISYREGKAGASVRAVTENLFARWCAESSTPPLFRIVQEIESQYKSGAASAAELSRLLSERGFPSDAVVEVADALATTLRDRPLSKDRLEAICWRLYSQAIRKMCVQTGHVLVARMLLYRIGEDGSIFPTRISGSALSTALSPAGAGFGAKTPALGLFERFRSEQESFLPVLYRLSEFDWWLIPSDKRSALNGKDQSVVADLDKEIDLAFQRCFRSLDRYQFDEVDVDVWRNVYQHYMPWEERQRLGGFYTPDELVELILDEIGYHSDDKDLTRKTFIDPACGSGTFLVAALARLLKHLAKYGPPGMPSGRQPSWVRAERELRVVQECLHGVDIHPFAAFLATLNTLFMVLSRYKEVKDKNPQFVFEPSIMVHDSLVLTTEEADLFAAIQEQVNGRVQRAREDHKRYAALLEKQFDYVIGNPPWSGILKGPLAAVYDEAQKKRLKTSFPTAAVGKYDIFGLFMERSLRFLKPGGRFGLVTQDTYFEKDWAGTLRRRLSSDTTLLCLVDLNPCGQLFFHAMNTPAITVVGNCKPPADHQITVAVVHKPTGFEGLNETDRRAKVLGLAKKALAGARKTGQCSQEFVEAFRKPQGQFAEAGKGRWHLAPEHRRAKVRTDWTSLGELFETAQGVTPGGEGCLDLFLMDESYANAAGFEDELIHPVVKGLDIKPYRCGKTGRVILYPYVVVSGSARPAFNLAGWKARQKADSMPAALRSLNDALDYHTVIDAQEAKYRGSGALDETVLRKLLSHREALGLVTYPKVAGYLTGHYNVLAGRVFEKRVITEWGKQWYEYHRPRDIESMLRKPKLISPRLTRQVRFTLDRKGIVPQDSCIAMVVAQKTAAAWQRFTEQLSGALGKRVDDVAVMKAVLGFANSEYAQKILVTGRRPTPKGSYQVTDDLLDEIQIPPIKSGKLVAQLLEAVEVLIGSDSRLHPAAQGRVDATVHKIVASSRL